MFHKAGLVTVISEVEGALEREPSLTPLAKAMLRGDIISEESIKALPSAGKGGQGGVFIVSEKEVIKLYETKEARVHKSSNDQTITQTAGAVQINIK